MDAMQIKKIYNFDHACISPKEIIIGQFKITITEEHCDNVGKLSKNASQSFTTNSAGDRCIETKMKFQGGIEETATVSWEEHSLGQSILFPDSNGTTQFYDLMIMLSFLTGRRVYQESELQQHPTTAFSNAPISRYHDYVTTINFWPLMDKIKTSKVGIPIGNIVQSSVVNELIGTAAYANAALDSIVSAWCKKNQKSKYSDGSVIRICEDEIRQHLKSKLTECLAQKLGENEMQDIVDRLVIEKQPSAILKLNNFLVSNGLFPSNPTDESKFRLKWMNILRNNAVHNGTVKNNNKIDSSMLNTAALGAVMITINIVQYYICSKILEMPEDRTQQTKIRIEKYFNEGVYNGQYIFDENHQDYFNKIEKEWLDNGKFDCY